VVLRCVERVRIALANEPHEIVVVDNCSRDDGADLVRRTYPDVTVIQNTQNLGYGSGNNVGGRYLLSRDCQYLAFLNPDVSVYPQTLSSLRNTLEETSDGGCAGGVAETGTGSPTFSFRNRPHWLYLWILEGTLRHLPGFRRLLAPLVAYCTSRYAIPVDPSGARQAVFAVSGACILFPSEVFRRIEGFDDAVFLYMEEFVIAVRLQRIGLRVYGVPNARYAHVGGHSTESSHFNLMSVYAQSEYYTVRKYFGWTLAAAGILRGLRSLDAVVVAVGRRRSRQEHT
jgi:N-acetylglucosaminyl-diphospho-decaprenol L-rhamnosyltransferase